MENNHRKRFRVTIQTEKQKKSISQRTKEKKGKCTSKPKRISLFDFEGPEDQVVERLWGCSSAGRAPALQAGGQEFESLHLHHRRKLLKTKDGHKTKGSDPQNGLIAQQARARA